ncbi:hypothetical protein MYSTI_02485 [Myxococcus stipitatus DSM 14675]|uniref:Lipoprotein n=1 Tax=Myxococcus stipitatus (strain DSM 14675 / JCM 12634 / Mx s8) TaxID=1278073 RepID=L7U4P6_MYXSD|nr:hypothetical protein MYSTI_02485 [Myxococcus stipitatus DSM 14675]
MKPLAGVLSVLAVVALFVKGFDSNGVMSTAEAAEPATAKTAVVKKTTTNTKTVVAPKTVTTKQATVTKTVVK